MNLFESPTSSANKLLMGPDGVVYVLPTGTLAAFQPSDRAGGAIASPRLRSLSRDADEDGGTASNCFRYSADVTPDDGGTASHCFRY